MGSVHTDTGMSIKKLGSIEQGGLDLLTCSEATVTTINFHVSKNITLSKRMARAFPELHVAGYLSSLHTL